MPVQDRLFGSFSLITDSEFQYNDFFSKKRKNEFGKQDCWNRPCERGLEIGLDNR
jgi:hypothetical protein